MRLGLVFIYLVFPWISAELIKDANQTTEENKTVVDETRRDDALLQPSVDHFKLTSVPLFSDKNDKKILKNGEHLGVRIFDQRLEQTQNREPCKNAQFLIELLTVMLPLLNHDVPENTKTSYVLQILKNVLLSSPEATQDHEVMYKINDLMVTLEKYHLKDSDVDRNALRQPGNAMNNPRDVTTKVIFQYEVPHFQNPNCTAELLKVIKVVHEAILQLANNPICVEDVPILNNIDNILINPELYKHLPGLNQNFPNKMNPGPTEQFLTLPEEQNLRPKLPVFKVDFPEKENVFLEQETQPLPFVPRYPYNYYPDSNEMTKPDDLPNPYYGSSPSLSHLINGVFENKPVPSPDIPAKGSSGYISLDQPPLMPIQALEAKTPSPFDRELDSGPASSPIPRDYIPSSDEISPKDTLPVFDFELPMKQPKYYLPSSNSLPSNYYFVPGGDSGEVSFYQNEPHPFELDLSSKSPKNYKEEDLSQPKSTSTSLLDVYGDGSGEVYIGQDRPHPTIGLYSEERLPLSSPFSSPFVVSGNGSGEISVHQDNAKPFYDFDLPLNHPKPYINANLPMASSSPPFDVTGGGSGEMNIGQDGPNHAFEFGWPSNPPKPYKAIDLQSASSTSWFDVPKDDSEELFIGPARPHLIAENDLPSQRPTTFSEKDLASPIPYFTPFDVSGAGSGEIPFGQDKRYPIVNSHFPLQRPKSFLEELTSPSSASSPFDISGSAPEQILFGKDNRHPIFDFDFPSKHPKPYKESVVPSVSLPLPFEVSGGGSGEIYLGQDQPNHAFEINFPSHQTKPSPSSYLSPFNLDVSGDGSGEILFGQDRPHPGFEFIPSPSSSPSPFEVSEDDRSTDTQISPKNPHPIYDTNFPVNEPIPLPLPSIPETPIETIGSAETAYIPIDQSSLQPREMNVMPPIKTIPNNYDASSNSLPLINGKPDLYPDLPNQDSSSPNFFNPKEVALLRPDVVPIQTIPFDENIIMSNPKTSQPTDLEITNQYVIPSNSDNLLYETALDAKEILPENSYNFAPWSTLITNEESPEKEYQLSLDKKVLVLIRDNIGLLEQKIPEIHLNIVIHDKIEKIKELINLHRITVEEYINILNQYEILIEHIKSLNGNNKILQELLFSMTNGDKLELNAGKLKVIELTYLVKRPKPLIYQPYYYIKYQLPYESFLTRINNILLEEPYLRTNPTKLYEALVPLSKVIETSPDLESFDKEDILKITFDNGTLVGAKVVKANDVNMDATLDRLREINADFTMNDIYQLIKNLDIQLTEPAGDDTVFKNYNEPIINTDEEENLYNDERNIDKQDEKMNEFYHFQLKENPAIAEKVNKLTPKKITSDQIIANILTRVNKLSPNYSTSRIRDRSITSPDNNISKELRSLSLAEKPGADPFSQSNNINTYNHLSPSEPLKSPEASINEANLNQYIDKKPRTVSETGDSLASMYSDIVDLNYSQKTDIGDANDDWNHAQYQKPSPSIQAKLLDATLNAHEYVDSSAPQHQDFSSVNQKSGKFSPVNAEDLNDLRQSQNSIGTKLLDATINAHSFKKVKKPTDLRVDSAPMSQQYTFGEPNTANSQLKQYNTNKYSAFNVDNYKVHIDSNTDDVPSNFLKYSQNYAGAYPNSVGPNIVYSQAYAAHDPINILKKTKTYIVSDPSFTDSDSERHSVYNNENANVLNRLNNAYYKNYYGKLNMAKNRGRVMVGNQNFGSNKFRHLLQRRVPVLYQRSRTLRSRPVVLG